MTVFDLIIVQDLVEKQSNLKNDRGWNSLSQQIRQKCDCQYPDGTSTWVGGFFGSMCRFCGRNDY